VWAIWQYVIPIIKLKLIICAVSHLLQHITQLYDCTSYWLSFSDIFRVICQTVDILWTYVHMCSCLDTSVCVCNHLICFHASVWDWKDGWGRVTITKPKWRDSATNHSCSIAVNVYCTFGYNSTVYTQSWSGLATSPRGTSDPPSNKLNSFNSNKLCNHLQLTSN
jgi:hypothetical protein